MRIRYKNDRESRKKFMKKNSSSSIKFYARMANESRLKGNVENLKKLVIIGNWIEYIKLDIV